jgi:hypothetical protein
METTARLIEILTKSLSLLSMLVVVCGVLSVSPVFAASLAWQQTGGPEGGQITALAVDPNNSQTLYAGTNHGRIFKTINGGTSWSAVNTGLTNPGYITRLAITPSNSQIIYAVTGGLFKSVNGGAFWSAVDSNGVTPDYSYGLVIDPSDSQILYAGGGPGSLRPLMVAHIGARSTPRLLFR